MNPGFVVKLRPTGPWRIGSDSGARNRVDAIYHSDSLYAAVASAMARLGMLEDWLEATARAANPAVRFSSCFPFQDGVDYIVPPRTAWPPANAGASSRVRWKSARFVPVSLLPAILAGRKLDDHKWTVDGLSECLTPAGRPGPFRTSVRSNAAVDRLTGAAERHTVACTEFRTGAGLWAIVAFADEAARERWQDPVKAAFRWLADSGFGGERSRGWGRSEAPEFVEGRLPELVLKPLESGGQGLGAGGRGVDVELAEPAPVEEPPAEPEPTAPVEEPETAPSVEEPVVEPPVVEPPEEPASAEASVMAVGEIAALEAPAQLDDRGQAEAPETAPVVEEVPEVLEQAVSPADVEPEQVAEAAEEAAVAAGAVTEADAAQAPAQSSASDQGPAVQRHWLLSLYSPAPVDAVDWAKGNYAVLTRGGRIESPAGTGELKKQLTMVAEGSVVCATEPPQGAAPDVAPDGFAHPVYRAGFAVSISLPEGR
jgi:CRISPR type III-A-associated RAMP protein Csm4